MRDSGHVPLFSLCACVSAKATIRGGCAPRSNLPDTWQDFCQASLIRRQCYQLPSSGQPAISTVWQMTLTSANTEGFLWLTHAEVDGLQRRYGGRETYSHTESSTVQASRQAGKDRWLTLMPVPFDPLEQMHPLCSLFTNTYKYTHSDIFPLMIGFITFFLLRLESSAILLQSREPWSLLWEELLNVTTASR